MVFLNSDQIANMVIKKYVFQNLEIQNGGRKCEKLVDSDGTQCLVVFGVADYELELKIQKLKIQKFKMVVQYAGPK